MTLTIGRFEIDECPYDITHDGDRLSFSFDIDGSTTGGDHDVAKVYRQQLLGLVDNDDEPVVPVTWEDDPDWDGFYRVGAVSMVPTPVYLLDSSSVRHFSVRVDLERVGGGYAKPLVETLVVSAVRTNDVGGVDGDGFEGVTGWRLRDEPIYGEPSGFSGTFNRTTADGPIAVSTGAAPFALAHGSTVIAADRFYDASARIEVQIGGSWYPVIGRQLPTGVVSNWRIQNGLVEFSPSATNVGDLRVRCFDSGVWVDMATELRYGSDSGGTFSQPNSEGGFFTGYDQANSSLEWAAPAIVRNDRYRVALEFTRSASYVQTITLDAADMFAVFHSTISSGWTHAIQSRSASWASSSIATGSKFSYNPGIRGSADDANGNRLVVLYVDDGSWTKYGTPSGIYAGATATSVTYGIGVELGGSSAASGDANTDLAEQYMAVKSWTSRVVAR